MAPMFTLDDTLDDAHEDIVSDMPEPQQHAIDEAQRQAAAEAADAGTAGIDLDALGIPWDPALHATGKDGHGVKSKGTGAWKKRRGLGGSASTLRAGAGRRDAAPDADPAVEREAIERASAETQARMAGAMMAQLQIRLSVGIGGVHFLPRELRIPGAPPINETEMLSGAWGDYFVAQGITQLPPWAALLGAMAMYYLPRFNEPEVRQRTGGFFRKIGHGFKSMWHWYKYRKSGGKPPGPIVTEKERGEATLAEAA
jgi:hypothetical protein